jgi:hypothetical protein
MSHIHITNPAIVLEEMVVLFADFDIDGIEDVFDIYEERGYTGMSILINDAILWKRFLQEFAQNWDAQISPNPDGSVNVNVLKWGTEVAEVELTSEMIDYESLKHIPDRSNVTIEIQRNYDYNYRTKIYALNPADLESTVGYRGEKKIFYGKHHTDSSTNLDVTARTLFLTKVPLDRYEFRVLPQNGKNIDVGMVISAPFPAGPYTDTRLLLVFSKKPDDTGDIFRVLDISTINEGLIILYNASDSRNYLLAEEGSEDARFLL